MAMADNSSDETPNSSPDSSFGNKYYSENLKARTLGETKPWIDYAVQQAQLAQISVQGAVDSTVAVTRSRLERFLSTGTAHLHQTIDSIQDFSSVYGVYEDIAVQKIKESLLLAASYPVATCSAAVGLGCFTFKRPRRFLYYKTLRVFMSEEALLSRASSKVKELQKSIDVIKAESDKLERKALQAEEEMMRGRTKLRQAGKQIQGVIRSAYKIETQARGLKDVLGELPRREASLFRSQVSNLASEAKKERNALGKEVSKISNHGISV